MLTKGRRQRPAGDISIHEAAAGDAAAISRVLHTAFAEFRHLYTPAAFRATTPGPAGVAARLREGKAWVARRADVIVGTASVVSREGELYVRGMAVVAAARQFGIAWQLLAIIEQFARDNCYPLLTLSTTPFLTGAIRLYEAFGFRRSAGGHEDLFGTPLFTMTKPLEGGGVVITPGHARPEP